MKPIIEVQDIPRYFTRDGATVTGQLWIAKDPRDGNCLTTLSIPTGCAPVDQLRYVAAFHQKAIDFLKRKRKKR